MKMLNWWIGCIFNGVASSMVSSGRYDWALLLAMIAMGIWLDGVGCYIKDKER
jgi:hypothetical protein